MARGTAASRSLGADDQAGAAPVVLIWLWCVAALIVVMVAVGGMTRLTDSGLSITEWKPLLGALPPLTDADWADAFNKYKQIPEYSIVNQGMSLAAFKSIFWWEWAHRFLGRIIGMAYGLPLIGFLIAGMIPRGYRLPAVAILLLGGLQGFVGWYMVQSGLVDRIDVSQYRLALHLFLALLILSAIVALALSMRASDPIVDLQPVQACARQTGIAIFLLVLLQVVLGAFVAGTKAGLTYNTWPLMDGDLIPGGMFTMTPWYRNLAENITTIQFNHRIVAYILAVVVVVQALTIARNTERRGAILSACVLTLLVFTQIGLGIWTLLKAGDGKIPVHLGVTHQTVAAIVLIAAVWHAHAVWRRRAVT